MLKVQYSNTDCRIKKKRRTAVYSNEKRGGNPGYMREKRIRNYQDDSSVLPPKKLPKRVNLFCVSLLFTLTAAKLLHNFCNVF